MTAARRERQRARRALALPGNARFMRQATGIFCASVALIMLAVILLLMQGRMGELNARITRLESQHAAMCAAEHPAVPLAPLAAGCR